MSEIGSINIASESAGGPGGGVNTIAAADASVTVAGTPTDKTIKNNLATTPPPNVAGASATGTSLLSAREDHTHGGGAGMFEPVRAIATDDIVLTGPQTIDGVACIAGNRVLVAGQASASQNGVYVVGAGAWSRAADFDAALEMIAGTTIAVQEGTAFGGSLWMFTTTGAIVVGTTPLEFSAIGPSFGPDTSVFLPNSAGALKTVSRWVSSYTSNAAGNEYSKITLKALLNGVETDVALLQTPSGGAEAYFGSWLGFIADVDTGFANSPNTLFIYCGNLLIGAYNAAGFILVPGRSYGWGGYTSGTFFNNITGDIDLRPDSPGGVGNVNLGLVAGALATNATHGFVTIPTCNGVPTGIVTVPAGQAAIVLNIADGKIYSSTGGGVWVAA